jgi:O-methyltransferase
MPAEPQNLFRNLPRLRDSRIKGPAAYARSVVIPYATYSPWIEDSAFELWSLVEQTVGLGGDILEVGVWRGGTGCLMAAQAKRQSPSTQVVLCGTFTGVAKAGAKDTVYRGGEHADASMEMVAKLAGEMGLDNIAIRQGVFPDEIGASLSDRRFSLCHLDVDVYESARQAFDWVWSRLVVGGVVVFDDYGFAPCDGVTRMVNERLVLRGGLVLHNLNGHALIVKTS